MSEPTLSCLALSCSSCNAWLGLDRMRVLTVAQNLLSALVRLKRAVYFTFRAGSWPAIMR